MATSAQGIWYQVSPSTTESKLPKVKANSTQQESSSSGSATSIAANDFLTLLVTEMKNQDPTATTDPNEYVNQLVQVNSLQQLISINETLKKATGSDSDVAAHASKEVSAFRPGAATQSPEAEEMNAATTAATDKSTFSSAAQRLATALTGK